MPYDNVHYFGINMVKIITFKAIFKTQVFKNNVEMGWLRVPCPTLADLGSLCSCSSWSSLLSLQTLRGSSEGPRNWVPTKCVQDLL